jgi:two-component system, chemotaxis family, sensor kinase CheA
MSTNEMPEANEISELINRLSEALVFSDFTDPRALADIHTQFMLIENMAESLSENMAAKAAQAAAVIVERVLLDEIGTKTGLDILNQTVSSLALMFVDGRIFDDAYFPFELGLSGGVGDPSSKVESEIPLVDVTLVCSQVLNALVISVNKIDTDDPRTLADIHIAFLGIAEYSSQKGDEPLKSIALECSGIVEKVLLNEYDSNKGVDLIKQSTRAFVKAIAEGVDIQAAEFPLALSRNDSDEEQSTGQGTAASPDSETGLLLTGLITLLGEADTADPRTLADLHTAFQSVSQLAEELCESRAANYAQSSADVVERILLDEIEDVGKEMVALSEIARGLYAVLVEGCTTEEAGLDGETGTGRQSAESNKTKPEPVTIKPIALPSNVDAAIFQEFLQNQVLNLDAYEGLVLKLEKEENLEKVAEFKRLIHTLKGDSGLIGLKDIEKLCHQIEDSLEEKPVHKMVDALLNAKDWLKQTFSAYEGKSTTPSSIETVLALFAPESAEGKDTEVEPDEKEIEAISFAGMDTDLLSDFIQESNEHLDNADLNVLTLETEPGNENALNAVFRAFHTIKGVSGFLSLTQIQKLAHEAENLLDKARKHETVMQGAAIDSTFDAIDALKRLVGNVSTALETGKPLQYDKSLNMLIRKIQAVAEGKPIPSEQVMLIPPGMKLGQILVETGSLSPDDVVEGLIAQKQSDPPSRLGEILVKDKRISGKEVAQALRSQSAQPEGKPVTVKEALKVDAEKLDRLVDLIGELVIAESMVSQSQDIKRIGSTTLAGHMAQLDKITRELQEMGTSLRMVPIRPTFQKMARLIRDLSKKSGKAIEFISSGDETELDKGVVERIGDPLVHMVRNAVDHGIESDPDERVKAGKPVAGTVKLRAFHKGGSIYIEIEDDGRGLNRAALVSKAIEKGLISDNDVLSDREVYNLIFEPGFSTAKKVTDVSGRGVGMDVVKKNIEALRGQVIITTGIGKGTVFSIRLPLTLAIIDGMVVRVGQERYIMPTLSIIQSIRPNEKDVSSVLQRSKVMKVQGELIPIVWLADLYFVGKAERVLTNITVVVVEDEGKRIGIVVDELLGQQQIVIKSLGDYMTGIPGISGGAIMPDGKVGLILDVGGLVKLASAEANMDEYARKEK